MLLRLVRRREGDEPRDPNAPPEPPQYVIAPASAPYKPGEGAVRLADVEVNVDPPAEWKQMYHEVWRIERSYFYDPNLHGLNAADAEKEYEKYLDGLASRSDLNYLFHTMLSDITSGHLRGGGGNVPEAKSIPGGLLGADYEIKGNRYCIAKIYTGGDFNPAEKPPLAQPGLSVKVGDCILAINGQDVTADIDIQQPLEGTSGHVVSLRIGSSDGKNTRDISVVPIPNEAGLRNRDWIDENRRKVSELSGGKLAYVYLPDTGGGGFNYFNRYYFAQTDKQGAIIDERFNAGGQVADYFVEVMG